MTLTGKCLCGAVSVATAEFRPEVSACHCRLCRVWSGAVQMGFEAPVDAVTVTGEVRRFRATPFSERAFCPVCGTSLWLKDDTGGYEFVSGFFDGADALPLVREVYADRAPAYARLSGAHAHVTRAEYERNNPHFEGDMP